MKIRSSFVVFITVLFLIQFLVSSVYAQGADTLITFRTYAADDWTRKFHRSEGWFGADGIFSLSFSGDESIGAGSTDSVLLYFSDTMTGQVKSDSSIVDFKMINNSFATVLQSSPKSDGTHIFYNIDPSGKATNYINPSTPLSSEGEYYWLGDGFVNHENNDSITIFAYRVFDKSDKSWDFEIRGVTLITLPNNLDFKKQSQKDMDLLVDIPDVGRGTFGSAVYVNTVEAGAKNPDGYVYIYGVLEPNKQLVIARVQPKDLKNIDKWMFYGDGIWSSDSGKLKPITSRVSNELSLTPMPDGRYLLVFQADGIGENTAIRIGETPYGPFGPLQNIWKSGEANKPPGIIPYNAKAHPVLSSEDRLLISYNTISFDYFNDIFKYPHMYRPRFFWLELAD